MVFNHPHLRKTVRILAQDNNYPFRIPPGLPVFYLNNLENDAARLSTCEKECIALGEDRSMRRLSKERKVSELHIFLNRLFDTADSGTKFQLPPWVKREIKARNERADEVLYAD